MRVLFARMTANLVDANTTDRRFNAAEPRWRLGGVVELRRGLNILGASEDCRDDPAACLLSGEVPPSTLAGDPTGTVVRGSMQGEFRPLPHFTIAAGARGQYSETPLFSFEQISGGNYTVGRGYDPGSIIGDRGVGLQAELRYGSTVPKTTGDLAFEPYVFIDRAKVWNEDRLGIDIPSQSLTSAGGGVRASFGGQMMLDLTFAAPLDRIGGAKPDSRVLLSLTSRLLPWNLR
jgi:hemolysin activation/secretion protein